MVQRVGGARRKTRGTFKKTHNQRGKMSLRQFFQEFAEGQKVLLKAEPSYQKGIYYRRYHGKVGTVLGKQGACYQVALKNGGVSKILIVHPVHLRAQQ